MITVTAEGIRSNKELQQKERAHCIFEYIYFARLDSRMDGVKVYDTRIRAGRALAKAYPAKADMVTGVPESGLTAARGYAMEAGLPFEAAFIKTVISGGHLSSRRSKNGNPVSGSS